MDSLLKSLLEQVSDLHDIPVGAYNIRNNGKSEGRNSTANIQIVGKTDGKSGIDIIIKPGTKKESVHIPMHALSWQHHQENLSEARHM